MEEKASRGIPESSDDVPDVCEEAACEGKSDRVCLMIQDCIHKGGDCDELRTCRNVDKSKHSCKISKEFQKGRDIMPIIRGVVADYSAEIKFSWSGTKLIGALLGVSMKTLVSTLVQTARHAVVATVMYPVKKTEAIVHLKSKCAKVTRRTAVENLEIDRKNCRVCVRADPKRLYKRKWCYASCECKRVGGVVNGIKTKGDGTCGVWLSPQGKARLDSEEACDAFYKKKKDEAGKKKKK
jgi:hypothetical protein